MEWDPIKWEWKFNKAELKEERLMRWLLYLERHAETTLLDCQFNECRLCETIPAVKKALEKWDRKRRTPPRE